MEWLHRANWATGQTEAWANWGQGKQWAGQIRAGQTGARAKVHWAKRPATDFVPLPTFYRVNTNV